MPSWIPAGSPQQNHGPVAATPTESAPVLPPRPPTGYHPRMLKTWVGWLAAVAAACCLLTASGDAFAGPSCKRELATYRSWLRRIKADVDRGAVMAGRVDRLVAIPLRKSTQPDEPAMTLTVDRAGLHDGRGGPVPARDAAALIAANRNIAWARTHRNAIVRGIVVAGASNALAANVHAAVAAAVTAHQRVWLMFRASDARAKAPPPSSVSKALAAAGESVNALIPILQREFGRCSGLMAMLRKLAGRTTKSRLPLLVDAPLPALKACRCKARPDVVASILWHLAFGHLAVIVEVPAARVASLPWGDSKATWAERAPLIVKALR